MLPAFSFSVSARCFPLFGRPGLTQHAAEAIIGADPMHSLIAWRECLVLLADYATYNQLVLK